MALNDPKLNWHEANRLDLLQNGAEFFPSLCQAIDQAQSSVHLETYIFNLDATGEKILDHLRGACQRGIKVRVVIDGFGSAQHATEISARLAEMGAQCRVYRPEPTGMGRYRLTLLRLRRLHRKVAVVDSRIGFVGGINIIDDLVDVPEVSGGPHPRFDFAVRAQGPVVQDLDTALSDLWVRLGTRRDGDWASFSERIKGWRQRRASRVARRTERFQTGLRAAVLLRDNLRFRNTIENVYIRALDNAKDDVLIANSYFFPGRRLRAALKRAAARGVRVRLLLQGRAEYAVQYRACRSMYSQVLSEGIEIYEYMPSYLHAKVAAIDCCAMVGSSNMDPFSLLLAREANLFVEDERFADKLKTALQAQLEQNCRHITTQSRQKHHFYDRWLDTLSFYALRIGVALTGKSSQY